MKVHAMTASVLAKPFHAALFCVAIFLAASPARAQQNNYDKEIDFAVDAFTYAGKLGGVDVGESGKALLKGAAKCVANNRPVLECARDELVAHLPEQARPMAQCLIRDIGNIDRNVAKCALETAAPLLSKQIPPETLTCIVNNPSNVAQCALGALAPKIAEQLPPDVQKCLKDNLGDSAKCAADAAVKAAIDKAMATVPPEVRQMAQCVAKVENLPNCAALPPQVKDALNVAEKLKNDVNTASNILKVAEGIAKNNWDDVLLYGGPEVYKVAAKIVLNALLTPALAPLIGPAVDLIVDNYTELAVGMITALKNKDEALAIKIFAEFIMMEQVRPLCTVLSVVPGSAKETACNALKDAIHALGDMGYAILTCEAIKKGEVPIIGDIYELGCGAATGAADIVWTGATKIAETAGKGATKVAETLGKGAEALGNVTKKTIEEIGKAADAIAHCKLDGILKDACDEFGKAIDTGGDIARGVVKAPAKIVEAVEDFFGGPDKRKGNNAECAGYAQRTIDQVKRNQAQGCGFSGNAWGDNYQGHYNWCLTVRYTTVHKEARVRDEWLNKCSDCRNYANQTRQSVENAKAQGCIDPLRAKSPGTWSEDYPGHFQFCMARGNFNTGLASNARNIELGHCGFCQGYQKAAENVIQQAKDRGCIDQMRGINANRWGDGTGHLGWCMSSTNRAGPSSEAGARARDIGSCRPTAPKPGTLEAGSIVILCNDGRPPPPGRACPQAPPINSHKRCPGHERWFHVNEPCPPPPSVRIQCWDGSVTDGTRQCPPRPATPPTHVRCPDGSWAHPNQPCPPPRARAQRPQPQMKNCPGSAPVPINANCPNITKTCPGGATIPVTQECPPPKPTTKTCPGSNTPVPINQACPAPPKRCPNGAVVPANAACPAPPPKPAPKCRMVTERDCGGLVPPGGKPPPCKMVTRQVCDGPGPVVR